MNLDNIIIYDVEVAIEPKRIPGGWENPEGMKFASAVVYSYEKDQYFFFLHEQGRLDLIDLLHRKTVVSFNGIKFDSRVVLGNNREIISNGKTFALNKIVWWDNVDLLLEYIKSRFNYADVQQAEGRLGDKAIHDGSFSLDGLAEGTFGLHKTGHGAQAPILYQEENWTEFLSYNLHDVRLTRKIFEFILQNGYIIDRKNKTVEIDLSRLKNISEKFQEER